MSGSDVQAIGKDQFEVLIAEHEIFFVDFWAEWCAPCKQFAKIYEKIAAQFSDKILFASVNIEKEQELAELFQIRSIPHLMVFKQGIAIYSESGSMPASTLEELVEQSLSVDVSKIRKQLEDEEKNS
ncbi:thioredoxin family protein [Legionella londiniensis]|uniref:Thioredoxin n=1 Tax=Legionella londiniensis TaxID=45068 RepID=A0A0W0VMN1_9GAMM|nr:thioredoxin domain-containing protein [Legionella londiniensis]KTD21310.1 thioredoxin [Legionella londiniensis]STX93336.1 thioredoxin [Legionella londiniensis]